MMAHALANCSQGRVDDGAFCCRHPKQNKLQSNPVTRRLMQPYRISEGEVVLSRKLGQWGT